MHVRPFWVQSWHPMPPDPHAMSCVPCTQRSPTQHPVGQLLASQAALTGVTQAPPAPLALATHVPPPVAGLQLSHCMPPDPHAPAWRPSVHTSVPRQHPGQVDGPQLLLKFRQMPSTQSWSHVLHPSP
jgi:hypothetical protein